MQRTPGIAYFGTTNGRLPHRPFGIKQPDRLFHTYVIGRTGVGKTTLLETLALQDIADGNGLTVIDPHGDLAERLVSRVPAERADDLVYLNPVDPYQPFGYNPLRGVRSDKVPLAAAGLMEAFKKLWDDAWGPRMEHMLRNALLALIEYGDATMPDVLRILSDKAFRSQVLAHVGNEQVRMFWTKEFPNYSTRYRQDSLAPVQSKVGAFLSDPRLYRLFTSAPVDLHFRKIMDEKKVLIVNLAKGRLGDDSSTLLGALLVTTLSLAAFSRADVHELKRRNHFVYIDEFQNFTTLSVANMVSELRKYHCGLILANQHLHQLAPEVRSAVLGNVGTLISFRIGPEDAAIIARELQHTFDVLDVVNLPNHNFYTRLMIDGAPSQPFSGTSIDPSVLHTNEAEAS